MRYFLEHNNSESLELLLKRFNLSDFNKNLNYKPHLGSELVEIIDINVSKNDLNAHYTFIKMNVELLELIS